MAVSITSNFDSGNIVVHRIDESDGSGVHQVSAELSIRDEPFTHGTDNKQHKQWFYFQAANVGGKQCRFTIKDVDKCSFPNAWKGYRACVSTDRKEWKRVHTVYNEGTKTLTMTFQPERPLCWVAYFAPYTYQRHQELIVSCQTAINHDGSPACQVEALTQSLDGRDVEMVTFGNGPAKIWIIARQHPGESMAEWWMEGFLTALLNPNNALGRQLGKIATIRAVPNMNPDGTFRGHLRTNASGANLNREWANSGDYVAPSAERSPEVLAVLKRLDETGCDCFIDVHGDEELPFNFFAGTQGIPGWSPRLEHLFHRFAQSYLQASPDFQVGHGYDNDDPSGANLAICGDQIAQRFDCLAVTLEQPFKDALDTCDRVYGWSPERSMDFGRAMLRCLVDMAPLLRAELAQETLQSERPAWTKPGYPNPPSEHVWNDTPEGSQ